MRPINSEGLNSKDFEVLSSYKEKHFAGHKKAPSALAWNTPGTILVTAETAIKTWFLNESGLEKGHELKGHDTNAEMVEFANSQILLSLGRDTLKVWDVRETGKMQQIKILKKNKVDFVTMSCCNSEGRDRVAVTTKDHSVLVYDMKKVSEPLVTIPQPKSTSSKEVEICRAQWDRTDSVFVTVGGEYTEL